MGEVWKLIHHSRLCAHAFLFIGYFFLEKQVIYLPGYILLIS